jgi:hypothetical protein
MRRALRRLASCGIRQPPGWASACCRRSRGPSSSTAGPTGRAALSNCCTGWYGAIRTDLLAGGGSGLTGVPAADGSPRCRRTPGARGTCCSERRLSSSRTGSQRRSGSGASGPAN